MAKSLSNLWIRDIFLGGQELNFNEYIVQVIKIKDFGKEKKNVRYRLSVSDGQYSIIVMINHALVNQMVTFLLYHLEMWYWTLWYYQNTRICQKYNWKSCVS